MGWDRSVFPLIIIDANGKFTGLFVYNPAPGNGNLIASIAARAGTDPFGNAYLAGIESQSSNGFVQLFNGQIALSSLVAGTKITTGALVALGDALINSVAPSLVLESPQTSASSFVKLLLEGSSVDGSVTAAGVIAPSGPGPFGLLWQVQGQSAAESVYVRTADVASFPITAPTGTETWHGLTALTYQNSWADSGVNIRGRYRITASPPNTVQIQGDLTVGTVTNGTLIATLPANYAPANNQVIQLVVPAGTPTTPGSMRLTIGTDGTLKCQALAGLASPNRIYFNDSYALD